MTREIAIPATEFQARRKKATEGWADDLKALADKAYPTLQDEAREQLAINSFLQQLTPPQVAFSVKQSGRLRYTMLWRQR